jgi:mRNA-degrading endonuclease RelE of RelBE toxin-antitoxin system
MPLPLSHIKLHYSRTFLNAFNQLPQAIQQKVKRQLQRLVDQTDTTSLHLKRMLSNHNVWEGRVDYHYRFTFERDAQSIYLRQVGIHDILRHP